MCQQPGTSPGEVAPGAKCERWKDLREQLEKSKNWLSTVTKGPKSRADTPASPQRSQVHLNQSEYSVCLGMAFLIGYRCSQSRLYIKNWKLIHLRCSTLPHSSQDNTWWSHQQKDKLNFGRHGQQGKRNTKIRDVYWSCFLAYCEAGRPEHVLVIKFNV